MTLSGESAPKWKDEALPAQSEETAPEDLPRADPVPEDFSPEDPPPPPEEPAADWPESDLPTEYNLNTVEFEAKAELQNDSTKPESSTSSVSSASRMVKPKVREVQMRVSSKHLILTSATFHTCLGSDKFSEGQTLQTDGNVVLLLPDEDPDAMAILLNIIHGSTRKVPRQVSLHMLTRLAFVVNHRQMHEAVELFSDSWIENLKPAPLSGNDIPDVLSWLFIFWVFQKEDDFRNMSQILEQESDHSLGDKADASPPIPASIISKCTT